MRLRALRAWRCLRALLLILGGRGSSGTGAELRAREPSSALRDRPYQVREYGLIRLPDSLDLFVNYGHSAAAL